MSCSLSVLLPVHNAQSDLDRTIASVLEFLPELTADFEVLIIDDGSTDDTADTAQQLVARYPQLCLIRHQQRLGGAAALAAGLKIARGNVIFVREEQATLELGDIGKLWHRMERRHFVQAWGATTGRSTASRVAARSTVSAASGDSGSLESRRATVEAAGPPATAGFKMFARSVAREIPWSLVQPEAIVGELTARGYDCEEIVIRQQAGASARSLPEAVGAPAPTAEKKRPRRPNYLARILALTSGN